MAEQQTVLQICSYYLGTRLFNTFFKCLEGMGVKNLVYVPYSPSTHVGWELPGDAPNVTLSQCFGDYDRLVFPYKAAKIRRDIKKHYDFKNISCIYAHSLFSNGYTAYRLKKEYGVPYIAAVCNTDVNAFFKYMYNLRGLGVKIMNEAEKVVFITDSYKELVLSKYVPPSMRGAIEQKSVVIPFGIDGTWLSEKAYHSLEPGTRRIRVVGTGTVEPNKNNLATARACALLLEKGYDVTYTVSGRCANEAYLKKLLEYPFVDYKGYLPFSELKKLYRDADIFVMPSKHETFGLVYPEAMSQGLPVIYTANEGFDRQLPEGLAGFSVDAESPPDIADKILSVMGDYNSIAERCPELSERFNWQGITKRYTEIFGEIAKSRS